MRRRLRRGLAAAIAAAPLVVAAPLGAQAVAPNGGPAPAAPNGAPVAPDVPPAAAGAPAADAPAGTAAAAPGGAPNPGVLGRPRAPALPEPPPREAPRARVSIVSPEESTVHKRRRGIRTQDGDGVVDGAAGDAPSGPNVERLQ